MIEKWKAKLKALFEAYGPVAIGVLIFINVSVFAGAAVALNMGWKPESAVGSAGTWAGAYVIYKLTMLPRIAVALAITPLVARVIGKKPKAPIV